MQSQLIGLFKKINSTKLEISPYRGKSVLICILYYLIIIHYNKKLDDELELIRSYIEEMLLLFTFENNG